LGVGVGVGVGFGVFEGVFVGVAVGVFVADVVAPDVLVAPCAEVDALFDGLAFLGFLVLLGVGTASGT
jgi:hypothetical protein